MPFYSDFTICSNNLNEHVLHENKWEFNVIGITVDVVEAVVAVVDDTYCFVSSIHAEHIHTTCGCVFFTFI